MPQRSRISLCKLLFRRPFSQSSNPKSPIPLNSLSQIPTHRVTNTVPSPNPHFSRKSTSNFQTLTHPTSSIPQTRYLTQLTLRKLSSDAGGDSVPELDQNKEVDKINLKFVEAREEIEMAMESKDTVYFDEEAECARAAVKEVVDMFQGLLVRLSDAERGALQRSMGMKIEQLKAEVQQLDE